MAGTLGMFWICLLFAGVHVTLGTTVNIPNNEYKIARGDNVTIPCSFTPGPSIVSISWTAEADVQGGAEIKVVDYFTAGTKMTVFKKYKGRASVVVDTIKGTADLQLQSVTSADTRSYECKVQDTNDEEGDLSDTVKLIVLVAPSAPICAVEGKAEYFQDINLTCYSKEGTPTPTYKWQSYSTSNVLRALPPKATDKNGLLSLFNISKETSGYYICTSTNEIRSATFNLTLSVMPPSMNIGSTAIIGGVVAAAVLLGVIVLICCCCRRRRKEAEEYAMGTAEEFTDKDPDGREDDRTVVSYEEERPVKSADKRDPPDDRSERSYDRRSDYDRRDQYTDKQDDRSDRRERYDRDDRRDRYDDGRDRYDDRRENYDDRRDRYDDRRDRDRYDDRRDRDRYDDRRERDRYDDHYDSDRYSDRYDSRDRPPSVPPNKPKEPRN